MSAHSEATSAPDPSPKIAGMLAEFGDVDSVAAAARKVRDAGYQRWDVHSPFPIHGIDAAIGIKPTRLPIICFIGGVVGCLAGLGLVYSTNVQWYPYIISGKPMFSLPANIPVIFETTVLLAAFGAVFGMLALNRLPWLSSPLTKCERFKRVTDDRFFIVVDAWDEKFDVETTGRLLRDAGALAVETVEED